MFLAALSLFAFTPTPVAAYPCGSAQGGRVASSDCPAPAKSKPKRKQAGEPNLLSLTVFVVALAAVLVIPINYARRSPGE